jgi:Flp pilus assembly protein TadD
MSFVAENNGSMPKSKHTRKNKRRDKAKPSSQRRASDSQALYMRSLEISDDIKDTYRPGITEEIAEATLKFKEGRVEEAQADFASIIEREPQAREAYMNLAVTYAHLGDEATAEMLTRQTMEKFPHYALPRINLARTYLHRNQVEEARETLLPLDKFRRFTSVEFQNYALTWSDIFAAEGNYEGAQSWINMLSEVMPDTPSLWKRNIGYSVGRLLGRRKKKE